ncbi:Uncharacterized protein dnm_077420 [Desulfonema magnum]|uniref:Uncharacterized protein n=1 Tax=Desulfonema magnum TaxID=45655 RepID=A0A975BTY0_9BACT|nr:Uncharacterized protein dnm_077420 [Desulfonema magnum]
MANAYEKAGFFTPGRENIRWEQTKKTDFSKWIFMVKDYNKLIISTRP